MSKITVFAGAVGVLAFVLCGGALRAQPRTIDDCEKIQATDAYNQCLASFGPPAKEHTLRPADAGKAPAASVASSEPKTAAVASRSSGGGKATRARRGGGRHASRGRARAGAHRSGRRQSASFTVHSRRRR